MSYPTHTIAMISYIEAHIDQKIDFAHMEKSIGFSQAHLRDLFRKNTGYPLIQYVRMRKIKRSAMELIHSNKPIIEIAYQYGFTNPETYTRAFQKIIGLAPSEFRKKRPIVGKEELITGIYSIEILKQKEQRSDISMKKEIYKNYESTILYGVHKVTYGCYGGNTPYPICLKACSDYLGDDLKYYDTMVSSAAAFRFVFNHKEWDLSNVDIYHTFDESNDIYRLGAEALGREFAWLGREKETKKEEFISFIKEHIDEGYPCIALGIIGPPEACIITGYRKNGEELLGWNFFQDSQEFATSVKLDESGYFISDTWWDNSDTQAVMCIGPIVSEKLSTEQILINAVKALEGRTEGSYSKGIKAYSAWLDALQDEKNFHVEGNYSLLFEKLLCHNDAINCLLDGRRCASDYFMSISKLDQDHQQQYHKIAIAFDKTVKAITEVQSLCGSWSDSDAMLKNLANNAIRKKSCEFIREAQESDKEALMLIQDVFRVIK